MIKKLRDEEMASKKNIDFQNHIFPPFFCLITLTASEVQFYSHGSTSRRCRSHLPNSSAPFGNDAMGCRVAFVYFRVLKRRGAVCKRAIYLLFTVNGAVCPQVGAVC
jgi:hypothetical protein